MIKYCCLFLLLLYTTLASAQYTTIINSSRPGYAETPFAVGRGVIQLESGFQHASTEEISENWSFNSNLLNQRIRFGMFSEKLEFKLIFNQYFNKIKSTISSDYGGITASYLGIGVKYLVFDPRDRVDENEIRSWYKRNGPKWYKHLPTVAINISATFGLDPKNFGNINFGETLIDGINVNSQIATTLNSTEVFKGGFLLQNNINDRWVILSNFSYERRSYEEISDLNLYNIIVAGTFSLNEKWSFFAENKNILNTYQNNYDVRVGAAFLLKNNLQFDTSINGSINDNFKPTGISLGLSWRLDNHVDKLIKIKTEKVKDTINNEPFLKKAGQNTKEFFIITGITLGEFFSTAGTDVSIFTQNLFLSKENKKSKRNKKSNNLDETVPQPKKPSKGKHLSREIVDYKSGKTGEKNRKRKEKALEKEQKAKTKAENKKLKAENKAAKKNKKIEDEEIELYLKAEAEAKKEEEKELQLYLKAVEESEIEEEKAKKAKAENKKLIPEESSIIEKEQNAKKNQQAEDIEAESKKEEEKELQLYLKAVEESKIEEEGKRQKAIEAQSKRDTELEAEQERKRQEAIEVQKRKDAELEAEQERKRQEAIEVQKKKDTELEAGQERKRQEAIEVQKKKETELEAGQERKRQEAIEAQSKRDAELEAEQERKRQEAIEVQKKKDTELEAEQERKRQEAIEAQKKKDTELEAEQERKRQEAIEAQKKKDAELEAEQERKRQEAIEVQKKKDAELEALQNKKSKEQLKQEKKEAKKIKSEEKKRKRKEAKEKKKQEILIREKEEREEKQRALMRKIDEISTF